MADLNRLRFAEELAEPENKEEAVLMRFDQALCNGASERTAIKIAAWAWLEWHPGGSLLDAMREVRRFLVRNGRRLAPRAPSTAWIN